MDPVKPALLVLNSCSSSEKEAQPPLKEESPVKRPEKAKQKNVMHDKDGKKPDYGQNGLLVQKLYFYLSLP